jgi:hypothetical protein
MLAPRDTCNLKHSSLALVRLPLSVKLGHAAIPSATTYFNRGAARPNFPRSRLKSGRAKPAAVALAISTP